LVGEKSVTGFTHTGEDDHFKRAAWLVPEIAPGALVLKIIFNKKTPLVDRQGLRGVFLGRFAEMLVGHFMQQIGEIRIAD
jgi:hypothetical protein